jgi:hypothetical protein
MYICICICIYIYIYTYYTSLYYSLTFVKINSILVEDLVFVTACLVLTKYLTSPWYCRGVQEQLVPTVSARSGLHYNWGSNSGGGATDFRPALKYIQPSIKGCVLWLCVTGVCS